jgi:predicted dehydrogenase
MYRRDFLSGSAKFALGVSALSLLPRASLADTNPPVKLRIALTGTGIRGTGTWGRELLPFRDYVELVALCDINPGRLAFARQFIGTEAPGFHSNDFETMIRETKPDAVIITTVDCFHAGYAVRAMELGCNVICEKPLATEAAQCQQLIDTELRTGKKIITTFNVRHHVFAEEIKKIMMSGELGKIISAEFHEYLDIDHGASYFRRWHGKSRLSGSLLCTKAAHHFDQVNWSLDAEPVEVNAYGRLAFYGGNHAFRSRNCRNCPFTKQCDFYWDITADKLMMDMYVASEKEDGYLRDGCLWDNNIDTWDTMTVEVTYNNGVLLTYSLNAFMPYEGQRIAFNGEKGRLDVRIYQNQPWKAEYESDFQLTKSFGDSRIWHLAQQEGGHGGADDSLKNMLFKPNPSDPLGKMAGSRAGVMASLIGIAARQSIESGKRVKIADLIKFPLAWPA